MILWGISHTAIIVISTLMVSFITPHFLQCTHINVADKSNFNKPGACQPKHEPVLPIISYMYKTKQHIQLQN